MADRWFRKHHTAIRAYDKARAATLTAYTLYKDALRAHGPTAVESATAWTIWNRARSKIHKLELRVSATKRKLIHAQEDLREHLAAIRPSI